MDIARNKIAEKRIYFWGKQLVLWIVAALHGMRVFPYQYIFHIGDILPVKEEFRQNLTMAEKWTRSSFKIQSLFFYASSFQMLGLKIRAMSGKCDLLLASCSQNLIQPHMVFNISRFKFYNLNSKPDYPTVVFPSLTSVVEHRYEENILIYSNVCWMQYGDSWEGITFYGCLSYKK